MSDAEAFCITFLVYHKTALSRGHFCTNETPADCESGGAHRRPAGSCYKQHPGEFQVLPQPGHPLDSGSRSSLLRWTVVPSERVCQVSVTLYDRAPPSYLYQTLVLAVWTSFPSGITASFSEDKFKHFFSKLSTLLLPRVTRRRFK